MTGNFVHDLENDLMSFCLKEKGKWWANHLFRNKEVDSLYNKIRGLDPRTVIAITVKEIDYRRIIQ